jgi:hypothetical protein
MRQRLFYLAYAGFDALLIAAALAFALYVSKAQWIVSQPGGVQQQNHGTSGDHLRRGQK